MSKALDNIAKLRPIFNVKEPRFGAKGDNLTDDTAALQAAIDAAEVAGGCVEIPPGTYVHTGLTISDNITLRGWEQTTCKLILKASSNTHSLTIPAGITQNVIIETLTIDGNRTNNATSGHGIYLSDNPETDASVVYGFSVVLRNVYVQNVRDTCLWVGVNRNMGHVENSEFKRGNRCLYLASSDWRFVHGRFAFPLATYAVEIPQGADDTFVGCAMFGATLAECVKLSSVGNSPAKLIGCTINFNQMDGIRIVGFSGAARTIGHQIIGCWFEGNGLATDNTYSDIVLEDTRDSVISGNYFRWSGSGNRPAYLVEFVGAATRAQWVGNTYDDSVNVPYATALTNTPTLLQTRAQALYSDSVCYLGGAGTSYSVAIPVGVSGGNFVQIQGRASGTGPDITAQGADTNVTLRISSKGTGSVEMQTGSLGRRVARFVNVASSVNYLDVYPSTTGNPVQLTANGTDSDVDLQLTPLGTNGRVRFGTRTAIGAETVTGYIEIKDAGGTVRKLAVVS